jgi:hypothetical protein
MTDPRKPQTKDGAVAFVSAVLRNEPALQSPDFKVAMDLSECFDIRAKDLLEYRKGMVENGR